ncbi:SUKH-3 domain-containing protein [Hymenobacter canadensis]|uniref:SUKH-3 domain-containing protein n=1 Tax=Hymenobacter canadensis TaxID=2999067 RepID=A0ABY7LNL2_9BACT|nr:SUKH-3 domain-containing protein [Hymenobacter canadensis]WBA41032.1 SUKH-3 domain-containing protein [Hymenobacter canadensis]
MPAFHDDVQHSLTEAGWFVGRAVSTAAYQQDTLQRQLAWLPAADAFLREYGGLHCYFTRQDQSITRMQFEIRQAATLLNMAQLHDEYEPRVPGRQLSLVGQAYTDPLCLLVDARGTFYGACAEGLYHIADTVPLALEAIILDLPFREL